MNELKVIPMNGVAAEQHELEIGELAVDRISGLGRVGDRCVDLRGDQQVGASPASGWKNPSESACTVGFQLSLVSIAVGGLVSSLPGYTKLLEICGAWALAAGSSGSTALIMSTIEMAPSSLPPCRESMLKYSDGSNLPAKRLAKVAAHRPEVPGHAADAEVGRGHPADQADGEIQPGPLSFTAR